MRTLGYYAIALQMQAVGASAAAGGSLLERVARSSPLNEIVLLMLTLFSVASWSIVLHKSWEFGRLERANLASTSRGISQSSYLLN